MKIVHKKQILTESDVNPLETNGVDITIDTQYKQAIIKAIGSESSAVVEYDQIMALEKDVSEKSLVEHFHSTLEDLRNEEVKHIAQLTTKVSEIPEMKEAFDKGVEEAESGKDTEDTDDSEKEKDDKSEEDTSEEKENKSEDVKESVQPQRNYDKEKIIEVIVKVLGLDDEDYLAIEGLFDVYDDKMTAKEVDLALQSFVNKYNVSDEDISLIEQEVSKTIDPVEEEKAEQASDLDSDIYDLKNMLETLLTPVARHELEAVIEKIENIKNSQG